jgi:hypothetical protein
MQQRIAGGMEAIKDAMQLLRCHADAGILAY